MKAKQMNINLQKVHKLNMFKLHYPLLTKMKVQNCLLDIKRNSFL